MLARAGRASLGGSTISIRHENNASFVLQSARFDRRASGLWHVISSMARQRARLWSREAELPPTGCAGGGFVRRFCCLARHSFLCASFHSRERRMSLGHLGETPSGTTMNWMEIVSLLETVARKLGYIGVWRAT